jgi:PAS domain S-box-containing protein
MSTVSPSPASVCLSLTRAISSAASPEDIYTAALDALANALNVSRAAVLLFDPDGVMRFKAWRGLSNTYRTAVEGHSPWTPETSDPQPIVVSDVSRDRGLERFRATLGNEGIAALTFLPLVSMGRVIGKFMLYFDTPHTVTDEERLLAEMIAAQVTFALTRTRAEESSRASEERLRFALDAAAMGTWQLDLRTRLVKWSDGLERIHGYDTGAFANTFDIYERIIHHEDRERVLSSIEWAIEGGRPYDIEYRVIGGDGRVRWVESKGRVDYEDGWAVRMTGICMGVTQRKEEEFARLAHAHETNQLKDQFLATLSHELRTPLNAIIGWLHVLERDAGSPERVRHAIDIVRRNAKLQAQLIEDILDVSRIITDKLTIEPQTMNITGLVETTVSGLLPAAALKQIDVTHDIPDDLPAISGDSRRLLQVFGNVLSNAIKFTPEHGAVTVRCETSRDSVTVVVQDSGTGIAPELLPYIFDRFRQGDSRSTRRHGGLGLGLAIARHIVELHGGDIRAHSDGPGRGATFRIRLPIGPEALMTDPRQAPSRDATVESRDATVDLAGWNVLVVDDVEDSRELLVRLLHQWGATVLQCPSAHTALAALSSTRFDLLIADIAMPELDGYDLIERVRRLGDDKGRVRAIAVTAYARREDRDRALDAGYDGYCPKPLDAGEFSRAIAELFTTPQP